MHLRQRQHPLVGYASIGARDIARAVAYFDDLLSLLDARVFMGMPGKSNACRMTGG